MKEETVVNHVYCMPGMAATPLIFEHIELPKDNYQMHYLSWVKPKKKEPIMYYAKRICNQVKHSDIILLGVSFGGVIVQEMQQFITVKRLVLISTIKTKYELPIFMRFGRKTKLYTILPTGLAKYYGKLSVLPLAKSARTRLRLYDRYIGIVDKAYLDWAIAEILNWNRKKPLQNVIHIHGDKDHIFPIQNIENCHVVKGGTHLMIVNRFRWFNQHLPKLIENAKQ